VRRSLSSVDNIGCLHNRLTDNRIGGIRLEIGEQATSLTTTGLNQTSQMFYLLRKVSLLQFFVEELNDALNTWLVALFSQHGVIFLILRRQLDGNKRITDQLAQRLKPIPHQLVASETQSEYLAAFFGTTDNRNLIIGRQIQISGATFGHVERH
jgi:CII-binding regulator of phage lambda lysogenization HflD